MLKILQEKFPFRSFQNGTGEKESSNVDLKIQLFPKQLEGIGRRKEMGKARQSPWDVLPKLPGHRFPGAAPPSQRQWSPCSPHQSGSWRWDLPWWSAPGLWRIYPGHSETQAKVYSTAVNHSKKKSIKFSQPCWAFLLFGLFCGRFLTLDWSVNYLFQVHVSGWVTASSTGLSKG